MQNDTLWTINDSGNEPAIYAIDESSGKTKSRVVFPSMAYNDWEEICCDTSRIFIGDFGNNKGMRCQQQIIILQAANKITLGVITFDFADQPITRKKRHNADCEAMIAIGDSILLFSKNRGDKKSRVYILPKKVGHYSLNPVAELNVRGLITAASLDTSSNTILLLGYRHFIPFICFIPMSSPEQLDDGRLCKKWFPGRFLRQTEAICVNKQQHAIISAEGPWFFRPQLFELQWLIK